ncbi:MAG: MFS transporter, partial [Deltaproteobacteria bacterium]|nr:MFS transporter [Deltaproteobacteria bacterium]
PAARASLPRLVDDDELVTANALQGLSWSVLFAVGMAAGGLLSSTLGPVGALFIDGLTFFVAALLLRGLPAIHPISDADDDDDKEDSQGENTDDLESPAKNKKQESFFSAFHVARKNPLLWRALWAKTPLAIVGGVFWVVLNLEAARTSFVDVGWHRFAFDGALTYGLFQSIRGIGTGVGPVALRRFQGSRRVWLDVTSFVFGILFLWTVSGQGALSMWGIGAVMLLWGMVLGHNWVESSTALSLCADDQWRGRLSAWDWMLMSAGQSFSALAGGFLLDYFSKEVALGAFIGLGFFCWLSTGALSLFHKKQ